MADFTEELAREVIAELGHRKTDLDFYEAQDNIRGAIRAVVKEEVRADDYTYDDYAYIKTS